MAANPLGRGAPAFNIPAGLSAVHAIDAAFHRLHAQWRELEDTFEAYPGFPDEDPVAQAMLDRATAAREAMFAQPIETATALALKWEAMRDGCASSLVDLELPGGLSVMDAIERDIRRIAQREVEGLPVE